MSVDDIEFSPVQTKMMKILRDGQPHAKEELHKCLWDELSGPNAVNMQISYMRKKLLNCNHAILNQQIDGKVFFRLVMLISRPN